MSDYQSFLVPYDFSDHARSALDVAVDLAGRLGARIHLLHVVQPPTYAYPGIAGGIGPTIDLREVRQSASQALAEVVGRVAAGSSVAIEPHVVEGLTIPETIHELARQVDADLIVMGTHGRTGLAHAFLGSVAERTLRGAPAPVLSVQAGDEG